MSIEADLFTSIRGVIKKMRKILDHEIIQYGIGHAEMRLLMLIYSFGNCSQEELAAKIEVDRSNVGRSLKKLVNLGYITKVKDPDDGRSYRILITPKGLSIKDPLLEVKHEIELTIYNQVSKGEASVLLDLLNRIDRGMDRNITI